jgi:hypothetical protein
VDSGSFLGAWETALPDGEAPRLLGFVPGRPVMLVVEAKPPAYTGDLDRSLSGSRVLPA